MTGSSLAIWRGSPNHYNGRNGYAVDHITLHIMVGTLAGTDYCFQLASFMAASHYGVGSDGTIYQWVDEVNGSWADANMASDCSGVTIEHAGGMAGIPVTAEEIEASARLCADIARRYGWTKLWHDGLNGNVYLHREIPGTDHFGCPDNTVNGLPVATILNRANQLLGSGYTIPETNNNTGGELVAISKSDLDQIWGYRPDTRFPNVYNNITYDMANNAAKAVATYSWKDKDGNGAPVGGNLYNQWLTTANTVLELKAMMTAQTAAIETLAKNMGANPADITAAVTNAVNAALKDVSITLTNTTTNETIDTKEAQ